MPMTVMQVRIMRMPVQQGIVAMPMRMRLVRLQAWDVQTWRMLVLVVPVVDVPVFVLQRIMGVVMVMPLGQMQPQAECHQAARDHQP
jgi:hypothetical protein